MKGRYFSKLFLGFFAVVFLVGLLAGCSGDEGEDYSPIIPETTVYHPPSILTSFISAKCIRGSRDEYLDEMNLRRSY